MRGTATVLMLVILLGGCVSGTAERWTFERANTPQDQVKRDANACLAQSLSATEMNRPGLVRVDRALYRACMEQRGYAVRATAE